MNHDYIPRLIERLEAIATLTKTPGGTALVRHAADTIRVLAGEVVALSADLENVQTENDQQEAEIKKLRDVLDLLRNGDYAELRVTLAKQKLDAERYAHIKSKARREDRDGGWIGYWTLPMFNGWDHTPYSKTRGRDHDHRDLDDAVDADMGRKKKL